MVDKSYLWFAFSPCFDWKEQKSIKQDKDQILSDVNVIRCVTIEDTNLS